MKVLNLIIKQKYFDEIIAGTKKQEFREIRPTTAKKYFYYAVDGKEVDINEVDEDVDVDLMPVKYDAIRFFVGYNKDRDSALVEVTGAVIEILVDEEGNEIPYEYKGEEYIMAQVVYDLGQVLEKNV